MSRAVYHIGHTLDVVRSLPDASVDLVLTSPPFLALRSYLPADDPAKVHEIGQEANPAAFLDTLLELSAEWRRVLAPHGSIAIELGDTYSGVGGTSSAPNPAYGEARSMERKQGDMLGAGKGWRKAADLKEWPLAKSLALVPELYRVALAYGINPLTGTASPAGRWRVRNVVRWHRPNPPVGALGDKYRPATTDMVIACTSDRRWFDLDAVREEPKPHSVKYDGGRRPAGGDRYGLGRRVEDAMHSNPAGAPPLDTWVIPTEPYSGAHYATWPRALCVRPIESMCPRRVCTVCGQPSRRIVEKSEEYEAFRRRKLAQIDSGVTSDRDQAIRPTGFTNAGTAMNAEYVTTGWSDCECPGGPERWRNGVVLDPFAGSGTTLAVATGCGRDAIGIDLDIRNADLARERIGMFLEVAS